MKHTTWGMVMAAGKSEQISSEIETAFLYLNDRPVLAYSLAAFMQCPEISGVVVVVSRERAESVLGMVQLFGLSKVKKIVVGGAKRAASMAAGLEHVPEDVEFVCVHDASRPMLSPTQIAETVKAAHRHGAAVAAVEILDPVVTGPKGAIETRQDSAGRLWTAISPQAYARAMLVKAYPKSAKARKNFTDDLEAMQALRVKPWIVPTTAISLRIRSAEDLKPVLALMK